MSRRGTSGTRAGRRALVGLAAASWMVAACAAAPVVPGITGPVPRCTDVPRIAAAPELYRDEPIYVANEMPTDELRAWASGKPGFEEIWIDRDHNGWITLAFSSGADERQAELVHEFPHVGVVAVHVPWTMSELEALQQKVVREGGDLVQGSGISVTQGVVSIWLGVLEPERVQAVASKFGGSRVCVEGIDPADAPADGPQLQTGDGWRLIADQDEAGRPYDTGIAADQDAFERLWADIGLAGGPPHVDFETEVAVWFGAVHGSSCPRLRLDDVVVDDERSLLHAVITRFELGACTADAIGHAYVVAVERAMLPKGPFRIQLGAEDPPNGAVQDEVTIVDTDLSVPGSTVTPDQLLSPPPPDDRPRVESGGVIEPEYPWQYRLRVDCGIEWLGEINHAWWRIDAAGAAGPLVPPAWQPLVEPDGTIDLQITMRLEPEPRIEAVAGGHTVVYRPSSSGGRICG